MIVAMFKARESFCC